MECWDIKQPFKNRLLYHAKVFIYKRYFSSEYFEFECISQQYLLLPLLCWCFLMISVLTTACFCILLEYFTSSAAILSIPFTSNNNMPKYLVLDLSRKYCNSWLWMGRFFLLIKRNQRVLHVRLYWYWLYLNIGRIYSSLFEPRKFHTTLCRCLRHLLYFVQMIQN